MRGPGYLNRYGWWRLILGLAVLLLGAAPGWGGTLEVTQPNQQLYPDPDFASTPIGPVPVGTAVNVLQQLGDWYKVEWQGKTGWLHKTAFPQTAPVRFDIGKLLFGEPVTQTKSDEVALASKGFTPEVEASYRKRYPHMDYALVEKVEGFRIDPAQLRAFIEEGGLNP